MNEKLFASIKSVVTLFHARRLVNLTLISYCFWKQTLFVFALQLGNILSFVLCLLVHISLKCHKELTRGPFFIGASSPKTTKYLWKTVSTSSNQ